jgi:hypothetical protein
MQPPNKFEGRCRRGRNFHCTGTAAGTEKSDFDASIPCSLLPPSSQPAEKEREREGKRYRESEEERER